MNNKKKINLTNSEIKDCETFEQIRISYNMNQKQWGNAIGISYGLVKRIEAHTIKCSPKTKMKIRSFIDQNQNNHNIPDLHNLEAHILFDIFLTHMNQVAKNEAGIYAARCTKAFQDILTYASKCDSPQSQETYFQFLEQILTTLSFAIADMISDINNGTDISNVNNGLKSVFTVKQVKKFINFADVIVSKNGEVSQQYSLSDFFDL